jgi:DNA-binding transcriptional regulator YdaS (Cro superfamily)
MSSIKKEPAARKWSMAGKDWVAKGGLTETAEQIGILPSTLSNWHNGNQRTPTARVEAIIELALQGLVRLTPADLGRPDLSKAAKR